MRNPCVYPLMPRSTAYVQTGQFWSIPLDDGRFGCGRVVQLVEKDGRRDRRLFLGGVLNWIGMAEPDESVIAGAKTISQGQLHVRMFQFCGTPILGKRELSLDGIEPDLFVDALHPLNVLRGTVPIRRARTNDAAKFPVLSTWGMRVPGILAKKLAVSQLAPT